MPELDAQLQRAVAAGWALYRAGNRQSAASAFREALKLDAAHEPALIGLAQCQIALGQLNEAMQTVATLLHAAPNDADAHRLKAEALRRLKRPQEALKSAREAISLSPDNPLGYHILGVIHYGMKDYRAALAVVREGRQRAPDHPELMAQEALIVFETRGGKAAEPLMEAALQRSLESDYVCVLAGRIALARNQLEPARDLLASVLRRNVDDEEALSLYLLTDRRRYGLLRAGFQFPYWRREHGLLGWMCWLGFWLLVVLAIVMLIAVTHVPGLVIALIYRGIWEAQYRIYRGDVKRHFAQLALRPGF